MKLKIDQEGKISNLGEIAGIFLKLMEDEAECHEDVKRWGAPSECHSDVHLHFKMEFERIAKKIDYQEFKKQLKERCDGKWLHFSGLMNYL